MKKKKNPTELDEILRLSGKRDFDMPKSFWGWVKFFLFFGIGYSTDRRLTSPRVGVLLSTPETSEGLRKRIIKHRVELSKKLNDGRFNQTK